MKGEFRRKVKTWLSHRPVGLGLAQLSMHSNCETAGTRDERYMASALTAFYEAEICAEGDGAYALH